MSHNVISCNLDSVTRNIVSTVNLDCKLDLKAIALQARNAEYNPKVGNIVIIESLYPKVNLSEDNLRKELEHGKLITHPTNHVVLQRFAAVIMRIREPKTTALIFASGKMVSFSCCLKSPLFNYISFTSISQVYSLCTTAIDFSPCYQVCTGAKSEQQSKLAARKVRGFDIHHASFWHELDG